MAKPRQGYSVVVVPEGSNKKPTTYFWSKRAVRTVAVAGVLAIVAFVGMAASWSSLARRVADAGDLAGREDALDADKARTAALVRQVAELEERQARFRVLLGQAEPMESSLWRARIGAPAGRPDIVAPGHGPADNDPLMWPLTAPGFVTQPLVESGAADDHPGVDIAVPSDSYILAAGAGEVVEAAEHPVYGQFVLLDHGNGLRSLYGHASELVVERGRRVRRGEVIALSGSTGRSTAPHLHFEILRGARPIDPLSMVAPPEPKE